jgi:hypothetical protein
MIGSTPLKTLERDIPYSKVASASEYHLLGADLPELTLSDELTTPFTLFSGNTRINLCQAAFFPCLRARRFANFSVCSRKFQ